MASSWGGVVSEQADLISSRLRQLMSSGLDFLHDELGLDLDLKPEFWPSWVILCTPLIGLLLPLLWVAACGGARRRNQAAAKSKSATVASTESAKAVPVKAPKPDEPKKKNKKKASEKQKNQSNGGTASEPQEQVKVIKEFSKQEALTIPAGPAAPPPPGPQAPVDSKAEKTKKNKKKPRPEVKPTQAVSSTDGKELDEGAWETKISNKEKRQQRKKEKVPNDESGSPGVDGQQKEQPAVTAPVNIKKNKVLSTWNNVSNVNSGGWTDMSMKHPPQASTSDREKSSVAIKTSGQRLSEPLAWVQESEAGSWRNMDGRIKPDAKQMNFSMLRLNQSAAGVLVTQSTAESGNGTTVSEEWSGFNGLGVVDPGSDWNAPTELWGNYDEPKPEMPAAQETPISLVPRVQESDDDKDKGDPGSGKSKRKKKKKKKPEDENSGSQVTIESSSAPAESGGVKPRPILPVVETTKQIITPQSGQKKSDQNSEPLKQVQKKKARRET